MELKFNRNGEEGVLIVENTEYPISEGDLKFAVRCFREKIRAEKLFGSIKDVYQVCINGEKYIQECLFKYVPKIHTCPHCGSKNVDYYHIDRCSDLPF